MVVTRSSKTSAYRPEVTEVRNPSSSPLFSAPRESNRSKSPIDRVAVAVGAQYLRHLGALFRVYFNRTLNHRCRFRVGARMSSSTVCSEPFNNADPCIRAVAKISVVWCGT